MSYKLKRAMIACEDVHSGEIGQDRVNFYVDERGEFSCTCVGEMLTARSLEDLRVQALAVVRAYVLAPKRSMFCLNLRADCLDETDYLEAALRCNGSLYQVSETTVLTVAFDDEGKEIRYRRRFGHDCGYIRTFYLDSVDAEDGFHERDLLVEDTPELRAKLAAFGKRLQGEAAALQSFLNDCAVR